MDNLEEYIKMIKKDIELIKEGSLYVESYIKTVQKIDRFLEEYQNGNPHNN